jgi:hypothetical protein
MALREIVARIGHTLVKAAEGNYRPGPWILPVSGGWLPADSSDNWWQNGGSIQRFSPSAMVEFLQSDYRDVSR